MLDGLPVALLHERDQRDGDIGHHEHGEREHVQNLLARGGTDGVPFHERGQHAEHEHEDEVVQQAEQDGRQRGGNLP